MAICDPEFHVVNITNEIEFLVIASHGIWDCMTSQAVVDFVRQYLRSGLTDLCFICERLVDRGLTSNDNTTAILVQFKASTRLPALTESDNEGEDA
uniref:protein-serine/threonine phosphatase n=1 Tax=Arundo donax TaxID=35708 RepID=A0A0A9HH92_ARUDO